MKRVTQAEVARIAGVSQAMVSLVLNGSSGVPIAPETRARVEQALRGTGYTVDIMGRRLRGKGNNILGVFSYESVFPADFYRPILLGIEAEAEAQGYDLLLFTSSGRRAGRRQVYENGTNRLGIADGSILLGRHNDPADLARLVRERFPFVFIGRRESPAGPIDYVGADYVEATRQCYDWLWRLGHRRIALLGVAGDHEPTVDRRRGHELAARRHRRTPLVLHQEDPAEVWHALAAEQVTGVLVETTAMAEGLYAQATAAGLSLPGDLSLILLGDNDPSQGGGGSAVDWSMFRIPREEMGAAAVRMLVELLAGRSPDSGRHVLLPCALHEGGTVAAPVRR
ncbi:MULTISPECIES: LacI family DNA-binding transcriptional regulator [unclassified Crossiella]|uniref:LacI family DNA-binding transcriptional regulator n=1 Tax=unclassified Crossiella TaxID=2620835 RepID=UPI001FFE8FBE|nr:MULTISPECIES: LacI family DNA-binding transcriptional regulator [unclassified Crossiella]MCK2241492.1 LacI family transcriptional regulator [Crossiella sp. S99.2]MCK2255636.1 LacI family transcriptional regulator [Crossiella sp. S99.1]